MLHRLISCKACLEKTHDVVFGLRLWGIKKKEKKIKNIDIVMRQSTKEVTEKNMSITDQTIGIQDGRKRFETTLVKPLDVNV